MGFLTTLFIGNGQLSPASRNALESEGLVLLEENLPGTVRYKHFKAPGRRHHGKVTAERLALGISEKRMVVYFRSGRAKLIDTAFSEQRLEAVDVSVDDEGRVSFRIDLDRADIPRVSGEITIAASTPNAVQIVDQLRSRMGRE